MTLASAVAIAEEECGPGYWDAIAILFVNEWRFQGSLGFGGKFFRDSNGYRVSCYPEDKTPERNAAISRANSRLQE
jgi:hypothetical protein